MTCKDAALLYRARFHWSVMPVARNQAKTPLLPWTCYQEACASESVIGRWWSICSDINVGVITGSVSGLVVLDDDGDGGDTITAHGGLPRTPTVRTAKGRHYYFAHPGPRIGNFCKRLPGLDLRGDGGYVLAPPSVHFTGAVYQWVVSPVDCAPAPLPAWLLPVEEPAPSPGIVHAPAVPRRDDLPRIERYVRSVLQNAALTVAGAVDGEKNLTLFNRAQVVAGYLHYGCVSEDEAASALYSAVAQRARDKRRAWTTIRDGLRIGRGKPLDVPPATESDARPAVWRL